MSALTPDARERLTALTGRKMHDHATRQECGGSGTVEPHEDVRGRMPCPANCDAGKRKGGA